MDTKQKNKLMWQVPFLVLLIIGTVLIIRQQQSEPYQHNKGFVFGTIYNVTYQSSEDLQAEIEAEMKKVDLEFSMYNDSSTVARINRGEMVKGSAMFDELFQLSQTINKETDGAFDITVAPLVNAWGFGFKHEQMPTPQQVDSLLKIRDQLDFSAIAKGFGSDVVARLLRSHGIQNFMVEIGGEIVTSGVNAEGQPWRVGISKPVEDPMGTDNGVQSIVKVTDKAMATSGNYRNFYYKDGKRYAHTIDPKTGYPVQHSILSATVFAKSCAVADAYATSFMVMGMEKAKQLLEHHPELMAYLIYSDEDGKNAVWYSPSLENKIQK